jgi:hypothetical protein
VGDSLDLLLPELAALRFCQPDGTFITTLQDLRELLEQMAQTGEGVVVDGLATECDDLWLGQQKVLYDAKRHAHTAQAWRCPPSGATCCGAMGLARQLPRARAAGAVRAGSGAGGALELPARPCPRRTLRPIYSARPLRRIKSLTAPRMSCDHLRAGGLGLSRHRSRMPSSRSTARVVLSAE